MSSALERLLRPRSIAVIGGGAWCANVVAECRKIGFEGALWPIHPKRQEIAGIPTYASIADLPDAPDATFIGINRHATVDAVAELSEMGAGGAVCFASGFREADRETGDGAALQERLLEVAGDMVLLGPNCYGLINYLDGAALWPDLHGGSPVESGVAIVAQSSNIAINLTMQRRGLPLAYVVTVGNQAQTGFAEVGMCLLDDPRVTALGLYIEGVGDLRAFEALSEKARTLGKPIVALKVGRSEEARTGTVSHTASLAGSDAGASALLERLGIAEIRSLPALLETLKLLHVTGPLPSNRIASMSCSGGEASLMADTGLSRGVLYPPLEDAQRADLAASLGPKVTLANPLDYHTYIWGDEAAIERTFTAMMQGDSLALGIVVLDFPKVELGGAAEWDQVIRAVHKTMANSGKPMAILASLPENLPERVAETLFDLGIVPFTGMDEALAAIAAAAWLGADRVPAEPLLLPGVPGALRTHAEREAKDALARHGLAVPKSIEASDAESAATDAGEIGFPLVLKGLGIAHKTEAGAVRVGLASAEEVRAAADAMPTESFLVEQMVLGAVAELLVGVTLDPAHGYVLTLAAGGVQTEILKDSAALLLPASDTEIETALDRLRIAPLLNGYRGAPPADRAAIIAAVRAVQDFVAAQGGQVSEVEINPLLCLPEGAVAVDALIRMGDDNE
ncbi:acetate--CoA ligase family protein [uncultured Nisaea sp.]|uniref:acetate--CoA ligase family protein n=1 Tax=uncultured Nisaea sp. TaxID=538215 RepID=UPI0030ECF654|tara:strand:- start:6694 stop:8742 length:2049 start_codon:yes stop_codon:yes gene_type:complete